MVHISFTICFEEPYWIGLIEESSDAKTRIGKMVFCAEPSNPEITNFVRHEMNSIALHEVSDSDAKAVVRKLLKDKETQNGTKRSLEIYKAALCIEKVERRSANRRQDETDKREEFERKELKRKQKKKGHY
jgi:hypothetical protein